MTLRQQLLALAAQGLRMPIGADLTLNEFEDPEEVRGNGPRLAEVIIRTAERFRTPLAFPLMDLTLEKADLLAHVGVAEEQRDAFHFAKPLSDAEMFRWRALDNPPPPRSAARNEAIAIVAKRGGLVPVGMSIGPFSLMTKLLADPITAVALAGRGVHAEDDAGVKLSEQSLKLAESAVLRSVLQQLKAGATAVLVCEPAASVTYLSPRQMAGSASLFERYVLGPNERLKRLLTVFGAELFFHNCGELTRDMVRSFAERLDPAILSLGSSRKLWEDAEVVPKSTVLFGNLPTKSFYSDAAMPDERVAELTQELVQRMKQTGHPFILGSECDVLHVPESAAAIRRKVDLMLRG